MADYRVKVRTDLTVDVDTHRLERSWLVLLTPANGDGEPVYVGRWPLPDHAEAVVRGCTALRFVAAGLPWRADT